MYSIYNYLPVNHRPLLKPYLAFFVWIWESESEEEKTSYAIKFKKIHLNYDERQFLGTVY